MPTRRKKPAKPKRPTKAERAGKVEMNLRAREVLQWLLNGAPRYEVIRLASEKWKVGERQIENYLSLAHELLAASLGTDREREIGVAVAQRQGLYALAVESGDFRLGLSVLADLAKLRGLYAPTKQEVTGQDGGPIVTVYIPSNGREPT